MLSLSQALISEFPKEIRQRGTTYFQRKLVRIKQATKWMVTATVRGSEKHNITLNRTDEDVLIASCTCPYVSSNGSGCKHLYAVLLEAESKNYLTGDGDNEDLGMEIEFTENEFEEEQDEDFEDEDFFDYDPPVDVQLSDDQNLILPNELRQKIINEQKQKWGLKSAGELAKSASSNWEKILEEVKVPAQQNQINSSFSWDATRQILYTLDLPAMKSNPSIVVIDITFRQQLKNGEWSKPKVLMLRPENILNLPDEIDREILGYILGGREYFGYVQYFNSNGGRYQLSENLARIILPKICAVGRCFIKTEYGQTKFPPLEWDADIPYQFSLEVSPDETDYSLTGSVKRIDSDEKILLSGIHLITTGGLLFTDHRVTEVTPPEARHWVQPLRKDLIKIPAEQSEKFLNQLLQSPHLPTVILPEKLQYEEISATPHPRLIIKPHEQKQYADRVKGILNFDYDGTIVTYQDTRRAVYRSSERQLIKRDPEMEKIALDFLLSVGFKEQRDFYNSQPYLRLNTTRVPRTIQRLLENGWHVEAEGKLYRRPGKFSLNVSSGIDWFELHGEVDFEGSVIQLPELLTALKKGQTSVTLGDGTFGILPEEWLKKYGLLAATGEANEDHLRFTKAQAGLLDALLATQDEVNFDSSFSRVRQELKQFSGVEAIEPPAGFVGELRHYQKEALGWFQFLQKFGFGGCLADDMGLGKTPMTLALLEARRETRAHQTGPERLAPSLVVVPKSLVFNWKAEAAKFTPKLSILDHTGIERDRKSSEHFDEYDLIITTYGTLRNDAILFKDTCFDYIILDEAQAIKNTSTESSKAARLMRANHKLALSGTPIENHLGELWSLFDFLNPGLLGASSVFGMSGNSAKFPEEETKQVLSQALRPFILRRTKKQVAQDLPEKLEQTIYCEMEPEQQKLYNDMKEHYRQSLLGVVDREGINKSKMHILEALLRLRQAACHPGLLDKKKIDQPSAKLDVLLPQLMELADEGHKTLVFSQFTSLLSIVRAKLDKDNIVYEYLDGKTRNRQEKVERFQDDPDCKLFLISLKAGGVGLNLTAADYVFLLDPWWNPAVEAQAIDRTHRIGQTKQVFAYRLIAKGTVEEKVLELQNTKRDLADAIISANNSVIRTLKREDLEMLLS